ncbi:Aldehyde/histidinol dehydrogenase [Trichoderma velutinum]
MASLILSKEIPYTFRDASLLDLKSFVGGEWRSSADDKTFAVEDPSDQKVLAYVSDCSTADYEQAIDAAHTAFMSYRRLTPLARGKLLRNWAQGVRDSTQDLAALCTLELGKPLTESIKSLTYAANCLDWFANLAEQGCGGETIPNSGNGGQNRIWTIRQPVGVVCAITPWNSPYSGVLKKIAPALAAGCTVVHKPAPETPLCAIALSKLCQRAGFPPGVYNMLTSSSDSAAAVGSLFCSHPLVRHVTFTGSTAVGRYLGERCGANLKKITMELGGNAAFIVFKDADLNRAVKELLACKFNSAGQVCISANRVLLAKGIEKDFTEKLLAAITEKVRLGSPWEEDTTLGPLYAKAGASKIRLLLGDALEIGATLLTPDTYQEGSTYYPPSVLSGVTSTMRISREEIFGPLVAISTFDTEEEAICLANAVKTGLAGYVFTENVSRLLRVAEALQAGMVGAQTGSISAIEQPFGGVMDSGLGREGSIHALEEYTDIKAITLAL